MFMAASFTIAERQRLPNVQMNDLTKCGLSTQWGYYIALKRKEILHVLQHGWTLRHDDEYNKPVRKEWVLYDSTYMRYLE